jgi:MraZ protein
LISQCFVDSRVNRIAMKFQKTHRGEEKALTARGEFECIAAHCGALGIRMSAKSQHLEGRYDHKMDPKYRVAIPSEWRPAPGSTLRLLETRNYGLAVVAALTEEEYELRLRQIDEDGVMSVLEKRQMKGILHSRCRPAPVNEQGKLLVPKDWSERAGLPADGPVVLVGRGTFFEIWSAETFALVEERENEKLAAHNERLGVF